MTNLPEMMALLKNFSVKKPFLSCVLHSLGKEELCTPQIQAIIKLIEKNDKDKD